MEKKLVLRTMSGLANRLRAVASGIGLLSQHDNLTLDVVWEPGKHLGASYHDLFEPLNLPRVRFGAPQDYPLLAAHSRPGRLGWRRALLSLKGGVLLRGSTSSESFEALLPGIDLKEAKLTLRVGNTLLLETSQAFFMPQQWEHFVPKAQLREQIDAVAETLGDHSVGVHIRRTDNVRSREKSPLSAFITAMQDELEKVPSTKFFLATDSEDIRTALIHILGTDVVVSRRSVDLSRDTKAGIEDAVIDMWILSRTDWILGSHWSSFSRASAKIGNVPFAYCYDGKAPAPHEI